MKTDNKLISNPVVIANELNNYFTNISDVIRSKIPDTMQSFHSYLKKPNFQSFFLSPTTSDEVFDCIFKLSINKSYGPSSIPVRILKLVQTQISKPLAMLINLSFTLGSFPSSLKIAKVIPILKKGSPCECNNYRPISLLSNIEKAFESLMYKRITTFLNQSNVLYNRQFGFRKNHSTIHALLNVTEKNSRSS